MRSGLSLANPISLERRTGPETAMLGKQGKGRSLNNLDKRPTKHFKGENDDITFSDNNAHFIHHPHCNTLAMTATVANNNMHRILVDNGSSVDILYYQAFQKMGLKVSDLKPSPTGSTSSQGTSSPPWESFLFP